MAGAEQVFRAPGAIIGGGRVLPSPAAFYLTGEDSLRIVSANSVSGVTLKLNWRHAEPNGETKPDSQTHTPNTNRTVKTQDFALSAGSLLNVTVFANAGAPQIGQTYVMVQLVRGAGAAAIVLGTLLAGVVTTTQALGWPGSPIESSLAGEPALRLITGTVPTNGVEFSETCPTGARWELIQVTAPLTTSAVAVTRTPSLRIGTAVVAAGLYVMNSSFSNGVTWFNCWGQASGASFSGSATRQHNSIPVRCMLRAGDIFSSNTPGLDAGDLWGQPVYYVREWLEVG